MHRVDVNRECQQPVLKRPRVIHAVRQPGRLPHQWPVGGQDVPGTKRDPRVVRNETPAIAHRTRYGKYEREPDG
jgi:hypothetical protein